MLNQFGIAQDYTPILCQNTVEANFPNFFEHIEHRK